MKLRYTYSIVVETENLGMAELGDLESSLDSIASQTFPIAELQEVLLIVGGHLSEPVLSTLKKKYPWVKVHQEKAKLDYARSKMKGAEVAQGEIVIFADSDMRYQKNWLTNMIETMEASPEGTIVSGDTRLETNSAYAFALNCTWMVQLVTDGLTQPVASHYFPLNNFAIAKTMMIAVPLPYHLSLYRNKIPLWENQLLRAGYQVVRAPGSRGFHAPPATLGDWWYRMLIYGADFVAQADFSVNDQAKIIEKKNIPLRLFRLLFLVPWKVERLLLNASILLSEDWRRLRYAPLGLVLGVLNCTVIGLGGLIACFHRDLIFGKITARELGHVV